MPSPPAAGWRVPVPRSKCWRWLRTPVITRDQVRYAKPDPDLFLAAADRLGCRSIGCGGRQRWDPGLAAREIAGGRTTFGRIRARGSRASRAYRVYQDPGELLRHLDEIGCAGYRNECYGVEHQTDLSTARRCATIAGGRLLTARRPTAHPEWRGSAI